MFLGSFLSHIMRYEVELQGDLAKYGETFVGRHFNCLVNIVEGVYYF